MKLLFYGLVLFVGVSECAAEPVRAVASVVRVRHEGPPMKPGVYVDFVVHAPAEFCGLPVTMYTHGAPRRARRREYPIGAVFRLSLPETAIPTLKKAKADEEHIQRTIDDGVDPEMISQLVMPARIVLSDLSEKPTQIQCHPNYEPDHRVLSVR